MMNGDDWCKHYNGIPSKVCDAGVEYESIKDTSQRPFSWHCTNVNSGIQCPLRELENPEILAEREAKYKSLIQKMNDIWDRTNDECPYCGATVTSCRQVGRCVYASPCGCRIGQGKLHPNWKVQP